MVRQLSVPILLGTFPTDRRVRENFPDKQEAVPHGFASVLIVRVKEALYERPRPMNKARIVIQ